MQYKTFDGTSTEVLRLNFKPIIVTAGAKDLAARNDLNNEGYTLQALSEGDWVLRVKHVNANEVSVGAR